MSRIEKQLIVANKKGLHARPAALFVQLADKFDVSVTIAKGEERVNGKSIMGLLMLGAQYQTPLTVIVDGNEAQAAMAEFEAFFSKQEEELIK
ncbi:MAG: HPr family phosphocarrier protein [Candidatus Omnitrophica bacterium]|nr:HPr family phosphocarrier protein [Candidatus Omnitrophota bacterium]